MIRLFFIGRNRLTESIITLSFDRFIDPAPDHTFIHHGPENAQDDLLEIYRSYGIDIDNMTIINDADLLWKYYPTTNIYRHGGHLAQQLLKLIALDNCNSDKILIQDCDTFAIESYRCFQHNMPVPYVIPNDTHSPEFYKYFYKFTGESRQTQDCFVTEFMPLRHTDWQSLRQRIEEKHQERWLDALLNQFDIDYPQRSGSYFSEYEILGNWMLSQNPDMITQEQRRLKIFKDNIFVDICDTNSVCMPILDIDINQAQHIIDHFNATVAERSNATDCKPVKP